MKQVIIFVPVVHFFRRGLASPHSKNTHQTGQSISTTYPAMLRLWKTGHWRKNVEPLTKAKEKLRVKSKFVVCSTEKSSSSKSRWNKIVVNNIIREVISEADKFPLISKPRNIFFQNNKSALTNKNFVDQKITELIITEKVGRSAVFWPLILETKNIHKPFIKDTKVFHNSQQILTKGNNKKCFIVSDKFIFSILALNIDFSLKTK